MSENGTVVGSSQGQYGFLWTPELGLKRTGPLLAGGWGNASVPLACNDSGQVAALLSTDSSFGGFLLSPGRGYQYLGRIGTLGRAEPAAMNGRGEVVGTAHTFDPPRDRYEAFFWSEAEGLRGLGRLMEDGSSYGHDVNESGVVVGQASYRAGNQTRFQAFVWTRERGLRGIGFLPGTVDSRAFAVNSHGTVLGESVTVKLTNFTFLWTEAEGMRNLGILGALTDLSDRNEVVGWDNRVKSPFSWTPERGVLFLNDHLEPFSRHWKLGGARRVNSLGWIACDGALLSDPSTSRPVIAISVD
jgi:probable HAF family extracellular repeat protein